MDLENRHRLKELLLTYSLQKGRVTLASGKVSDFYFDGKQTTLHPEGAHLVGELMFEMIRKNFPGARAVGGPTLGADPISTAIAVISFERGFPLHSFIVRKAPKGHGTMNWIEGNRHLQLGMEVVLVEDVITTGGSLLQAVHHVKEAGLNPLGALVLVDREEGGGEALKAEGLKLLSLFSKSELMGENE